MARNPALDQLDVLVGEWHLTLTNAWFLESMDVEQHGHASIRWLGEAFIEMTAEMEGEHIWHFVFGRSDPHEQLYALYHDPRPTSRLFQMSFDGTNWRMEREDVDMHQRLVATVGPDRIEARADASDDAGVTWRKDFDFFFDRA